MRACLQISYNLLAALNQGMKALLTGANTNPQTLAAALTAFRPTLPVLASTNTTITELQKYIVRPHFALLHSSNSEDCKMILDLSDTVLQSQ